MTSYNRLLVGTALCLLMAAPSAARAEIGGAAAAKPTVFPSIILAQADSEPDATDCPEGTVAEGGECVPVEAPAEEQGEAPAEEPAAEEPAPEEAPPETEQPVDEAPPEEEEAAPAETEETPPAEEPATEETDTAEPEEAPADSGEPSDTEGVTEPEAEAETGADVEAETEADAEAEVQSEAEAETEPGTEDPAAADEPAEEQPVEAQEAPEDDSVADECPEGMRMSATAGECVPIEEETVDEQPGDEQPAEAEPVDEGAAQEESAEPAAEDETEAEGTADEEPVETLDAPADEPVSDEDAAAEDAETQEDVQEGEPAEDGTAEDEPVTEEEAEEPAEEAPEADTTDEEQPEDTEEQPADAEEAPDSDEEAQADTLDAQQVRQEIQEIVEEEGERIELGQTPEDQRVRRRQFYQQREGARVIEEYNDNRTIIEINNNVYVESPDYDRLVLQDDRVYYEELSGARIREVIERQDGTRVITIRNRYGDVVRRVRVTPDGREYILSYVPDDRFDAVMRFEDPARDLPPFRLTIPEDEYILEAASVQQPDRYYSFLNQPPVEQVSRLYSLEEVQYSARVRDMVRRIDLTTIEFEFGSARIDEGEIAELEGLANSMLRLLDEDPAETFLIEGHTDAVGSELANLALSDRRAESVARALTNAFGVPPENLVTQGYGEQFLKVGTQERERANRRVAIRRITPLVSPVASR